MEGITQFQHMVTPTVSDKSVIGIVISAKADEKKKRKAKRKELLIRILFVDSMSNKCVADITMTRTSTESLMKGIDESLKKGVEQLKDKSMPEKPTIMKSDDKYFG